MRQLPAKAAASPPVGLLALQHSAQRRRRSPDFFIRKAVLLSPSGTVPSLTLSSVSRSFRYIFFGAASPSGGGCPSARLHRGPTREAGLYICALEGGLHCELRCAAGKGGLQEQQDEIALAKDLVWKFRTWLLSSSVSPSWIIYWLARRDDSWRPL